MTADLSNDAWLRANQEYLAAELTRLKSRLRGERSRDAERAARQASAGMTRTPPLAWLVDSFGLTQFERDLLLLCAGVEMDSEIAALCAEAHGTPQRPYASFGLALGLLDAPHWSAITPVRPLRRWRLIEVEERAPLSSGRVRIDERVLHYLTGIDYADPRVHSLTRPVRHAGLIARSHARVARAAVAAVQRRGRPFIVQLVGNDAHGQEDVAARIARKLGARGVVLRAPDVPAQADELRSLATLWDREATLLRAVLIIASEDAEVPLHAVELAERVTTLVILMSQNPSRFRRGYARYRVDKPGPLDQRRLWMQTLGGAASRLDGALDAVSTQYRMSARTIRDHASDVAAEIEASGAPQQAFLRRCRVIGRPKLDDLAQRLTPTARLADLVLPEPQKLMLHQIVAHARERITVYEKWGFARKSSGRGLNLAICLAGDSGTGKTTCAEALANELELDIYRVDSALVISKFIGESEKNLKRVFDAAEDSGAILLFDEADALFGKRGDVRDNPALDRYSNLEVSYLLQRLDSFSGLAILTTNQKAALDPAFSRRLRFIINFPFPDTAHRRAIWEGILPAETPRAEMDYAKLARLHVTGGSIRNIALNAAFLAADRKETLGMAHLRHAAHGEFSKLERPLAEAETRGWI